MYIYSEAPEIGISPTVRIQIIEMVEGEESIAFWKVFETNDRHRYYSLLEGDWMDDTMY